MEDNWEETAEQQFIKLSTTAVVSFNKPEAGVMPDLVVIIRMDFFRETIRENLDKKLRKPTHGRRLLSLEAIPRHRTSQTGATQDERSRQHHHTSLHPVSHSRRTNKKHRTTSWIVGNVSVNAICNTTLHREDGLSTKIGHQEIYREAATLENS